MKIRTLINKNYYNLIETLAKDNTDKAIDGVSNEDILNDVLLRMLEDNTEYNTDEDFINEVTERVKIGMFRIKANSLTNAESTTEEDKKEYSEE